MVLDYFVDICPQCKKISPYMPSPSYYHKCKNCGFEGTQSDLITAIDDKAVRKDVAHLEDLLIRFPNLSVIQAK